MAKRKQRVEEQRDLTPKEHRLRARTRQRNQRLYLGAGIAVGLALLLVIIGAVIQFAVRPNSAIVTVGEQRIITRDFWKRMRFEQWQLENQLVQMQQLQAQFGQDFFSSQISQIQSTLASREALGIQVLDRMIDEAVIVQQAAARNITVSPEEIEAALREEIANGRGAVTEPQATETAEAGIAATATAAGWTPTPSPTVDLSSTITATATALPTPEPPATRAIISETGYTEGLDTLTENLSTASGLTLDEYREIIRVRLLTEKLQEAIGAEQVAATEEQVHARHILIAIREPVTPTTTLTETSALTAGTPLTSLGGLSATGPVTEEAALTTTESVDDAAAVTTTAATTTTGDVTSTAEATVTTELASTELTSTTALTDSSGLTGTSEATATAALTNTAASTVTEPLTGSTGPDPNAPRTEAEALALAQELKERLAAGEDFAALAAQYSDDPSSGPNGGDLGWFGRGQMVPEFEEAAFSLPLNQVSEPIKSQYGYHLIEVLEKDTERPKDEATLQQERQTAFQTWLQEQETATPIERPDNLPALLPPNIN